MDDVIIFLRIGKGENNQLCLVENQVIEEDVEDGQILDHHVGGKHELCPVEHDHQDESDR